MTSSSTMATHEDLEEIDVQVKEVFPGWIYCASAKEFYRHDSILKVETQKRIFYTLRTWHGKDLSDLKQDEAHQDRRWVKDIGILDCKNILLVQGSKVLEEEGRNIIPDCFKHTVSSVSRKYNAHMLMFFSEHIEDDDIARMETSLLNVLFKNSKFVVPPKTATNFKQAHVYSSDNDTVSPVTKTSAKKSGDDFCHILKNSKVSDTPYSVRLMKPIIMATGDPLGAGVKVTEKAVNAATITVGNQNLELQNSRFKADEDVSQQTNIKQSNVSSRSSPKIPELGQQTQASVHPQLTQSNTPSASSHRTDDVQELYSWSTAEDHSYPDTINNPYSLGKDPCRSLREPMSENTVGDLPETSSPNSQNNNKNLQTTSHIHIDKRQNSGKVEEYSTVSRLVTNKRKLDDYAQSHTTATRPTSSKHLDNESRILQPIKSLSDICGMTRKYFGVVSSKEKEKVIFLVGASGSGKTTLVNFIASCIKNAKSPSDDLVYVEPNSKDAYFRTTSITAYTFCFMESETPITIIDTPGLHDSSGPQVDDQVHLLKTFIGNAASNGLDIHAVGFVARAHEVRLTSSERLLMDYLSTQFGQRVAHHLIPFITFIDNQKVPPVVEAMRSYGIESKSFLKFNNSMFNRNPGQEIDELDMMCWKIGNKSWKKCDMILRELSPLSVNTFKASQNAAYATTVMDSAVSDLKAELKKFIISCQNSKCMTKETFESCEQVWGFASVLHHLKSAQESGVSSVESILTTCADEVCQENASLSKQWVELLLLAPSRGLLGAGMAAIDSLGHFYNPAKKFSQSKDETKKYPEILFCIKCRTNHETERVEPTSSFSSFSSGKGTITYKCKKCRCNASEHVTDINKKSRASVHLPPEHILRCSNKIIDDILRENCPGQLKISKHHYLQHVNIALNNKFKLLIDDLLSQREDTSLGYHKL
ncbi:uncharacterized protein LOC121872895 isoform X2 [Homarus americanus]|nr:uncharacterized protein LOC121872895 isoform X2 [Homarus americanus]